MTREPGRREALGWTGEAAPGGRPAALLDLLALLAVFTLVTLVVRLLVPVPVWVAVLIGAGTAAPVTRLRPGRRVLAALRHR
ncbi:hypothetical protein [Streptomyces sp. NPDC089919]|uniref:hypothetical protein n=1 Tax=Streptomyces sp. NPDC089919 TaxID=3155188 RepID=UPI00342BBA04